MAIEKTLKSGCPTVDSATGKAIRWDVEVTFNDGDFERDYSYSKDVTDLNKEPSQFTKSDLLGYAPAVLDEVFTHHKEVSSPDYVPPTSTDNEFDINGLSSGESRRD
jgi:hypothetical protein